MVSQNWHFHIIQANREVWRKIVKIKYSEDLRGV